MKQTNLFTAIALIALVQTPVAAQHSNHPHLHINPRWTECSIQLDASLTQAAWRQRSPAA